MEPWFSVIPSIAAIIILIVPGIISLVALYFIIKYAVKNALKEYDSEKNN